MEGDGKKKKKKKMGKERSEEGGEERRERVRDRGKEEKEGERKEGEILVAPKRFLLNVLSCCNDETFAITSACNVDVSTIFYTEL